MKRFFEEGKRLSLEHKRVIEFNISFVKDREKQTPQARNTAESLSRRRIADYANIYKMLKEGEKIKIKHELKKQGNVMKYVTI